ncbi:MAG: succinyldiaminopimelate transaminase [Thiohalocapsa sp.]
MNPNLDSLQPYPFEKLAALTGGIEPNPELPAIALSIGEPTHPTPAIIGESLLAHLHQLAVYPNTRGLALLRETIAGWLQRRFGLPMSALDPERHILPVNGTREALFAFAQSVVDPRSNALVLMPNPFYQIYEGAALLAGAIPYYLPCVEEHGFIPDFDAVDIATWRRCQLLYLCSPGNPTGAVIDQTVLARLILLAQEYDFVIAADECYAEIYLDQEAPPVGLLQAAAAMGLEDFRRCVVFHSLSKRSNAPGLRSGFVAGDARIIERFFAYRTYHGCAMPLQHQHASAVAWGDEKHVIKNRDLYREKFDAMLDILDGVLEVDRPAAGFYLWPRTPIADTAFARGLLAQQHVTVLPGSFLSRRRPDDDAGNDPGANRIRMALVPPLDECIDAARRIKTYCASL